MNLQRLKYNPNSQGKEVTILKRMGLEDAEIVYLVSLKQKEERRLKLKNK